MSNTCELRKGIVNFEEPKDIDRLWPKQACDRLSQHYVGTRKQNGRRCSAGAKPSGIPSLEQGKPTILPSEAGRAARRAVEISGRRCWRKQTPPCNRVDRGCHVNSLRTQADLQRLVRYETASEVTAGGMANERGTIRVCILRSGRSMGPTRVVRSRAPD
jgi:hypothetical protein